jgi:hypothetical protein
MRHDADSTHGPGGRLTIPFAITAPARSPRRRGRAPGLGPGSLDPEQRPGAPGQRSTPARSSDLPNAAMNPEFGAEEATRLMRAISVRETMRLTWQPLGVELARDSTLGVTWGVAVITPRLAPGAPQIGHYTAVWRRDAGGWRISALLFTGVKPVATSVPPGIPLSRSRTPATGPAGHFVAADLAFARLAGDSGAAIAFRTWAAPDAIVSGGSGVLARGPDAIASGVAGPEVWRWHPVAAGSARAGDLGWTAGEAVIQPETGKPIYSKYLTAWIRPPGRPIRFLTDGGNARPAAINPR